MILLHICAIFLESKGFYKKKLLPRNVWSESCKCLLTWIWPQKTTMFLFLLYSCFLLFILWGSVLKKIIMLANSYIHKKDISIVNVYHVNLVKLYTIYHRKMMLLIFVYALFFCWPIWWVTGFAADDSSCWVTWLTWWPLSWHGDCIMSEDKETADCGEHDTERWLWQEISIQEIKFLFWWLFRNT